MRANRPAIRFLSMESAPDVAPLVTEVLPPLVAPGRYPAVFVRAERRVPFGRHAIYLHFELMATAPEQASADGVHLYLSCPLRPDGKVAPSSKYARLWEFVSGRRATRRDRMSARIFENRVLTVEVRTVTADHHQRPLPEALQYSMITGIVEVQTGRAVP
jgi:hypothetical protein